MGARNVWILTVGIAALASSSGAAAQNPQAVTAGELVVEPPTLISLGFEWRIEGDANRDAAAAVAYRRAGEREWHDSLPLLREQNERTFYVETLYYTAPNMFAGSVFELAENTEYEVRFTLTDPDGVSGQAQRVVSVRTRAEPQASTSGNTYHVYPFGYTGPKQEPAFTGLLAAYYKNALGGDWSRAAPPRVQPGDTILVHAGEYKDFDRFSYSHEIRTQYGTCCGTPWDGTFYLTQDGTAEKPIAIKAAGDGEVIFDGDGNNVLFNVMGADYTYFEGITFRNTNLAIEAGQKNIAGTVGLTVKHSKFDQVGVVVHSDWSGSKNFYIADNVMNGRNDPTYLIGWFNIWPWNAVEGQQEKQRMKSYYAVSIYGSGHVVAYNRVTNFHDGIDHATYGMPDDYPNTPRDRMPVSNDFYGNDVSNMHDNCFETDGGMHNMRVFRNRCFNAAVGAMSPQPIFGGPVYFIRNVVYNSVYGPLKIQADPSGILVYQNTYIGEIQQITPASNLHFRNNLIMGTKARPALLAIDTHTPWSSSDYNGFYVNEGAEYSFQWNSPPAGGPVDYKSPREVRRFKTLDEYQRGTGQDAHSRAVDYSVFVDAAPPDFTDPTKLVSPGAVDLRLKPRSRAVDAGTVLPGITDGFLGRAPDLGAYEQGAELPHYGPRTAAPRELSSAR
jgi:hypothetical protein